MRALQLLDNRKLAVVDLPDPPPPGPGEVQVRIGAVALNHIDVWGWRGMAFAKRKLPIVVGVEAAGTIAAVGDGVDRPAPGDDRRDLRRRDLRRLRGVPRRPRQPSAKTSHGIRGFHIDGLARERINLPARLAIPAPRGRRVVAAAARRSPTARPSTCSSTTPSSPPGQTILIQAGGSGIGTAAIQLAKAVGATVITTVGSDEKIDKAKALGADHVINYREERFEGVVRKLTQKQGVDVVFEHVGPTPLPSSMFCLKRGGTLVTCGSTTGISAEINLFQLYQQQLRLIGSFGCIDPQPPRCARARWRRASRGR